jgi:hypothetical protein
MLDRVRSCRLTTACHRTFCTAARAGSGAHLRVPAGAGGT